jgi:hypothetical protein
MAILDLLVDIALKVKARCPHLAIEEIVAAAAGAARLMETIGPDLFAIAPALQDR